MLRHARNVLAEASRERDRYREEAERLRGENERLRTVGAHVHGLSNYEEDTEFRTTSVALLNEARRGLAACTCSLI